MKLVFYALTFLIFSFIKIISICNLGWDFILSREMLRPLGA